MPEKLLTGRKQTKYGMLKVFTVHVDCLINYFVASRDFCYLMITFANSLDPDQDRQNVGPDQGSNLLTLWSEIFLKEFLEKVDFEKYH